MHKPLLLAVTGAITFVAAAAAVVANTITGPSSSQSPYVVPSRDGVVTKAIVTVGDGVPKAGGGTYRLVGIPDGLGAFDNGNGTFTLLVNHELTATSGINRAHGAKGAFVSKWTIRKGSLRVVEAEDLIKQVATWNVATSSYNAPAAGVLLARFCSGDLAPRSAFYNSESGRGYPGRLYMNGEETTPEGRGFAHLLDGTSYELPHLGKFAWENSVAHPSTGNKTVVVGLDDQTPGQVYVYIGEKQMSGNPAERAGLTGGTLYGVKVAGFVAEPPDGIPAETAFALEPVGPDGHVQSLTGAAIDAASDADGITEFLRPEDGAWDPRHPRDFLLRDDERHRQPEPALAASIQRPEELRGRGHHHRVARRQRGSAKCSTTSP